MGAEEKRKQAYGSEGCIMMCSKYMTKQEPLGPKSKGDIRAAELQFFNLWWKKKAKINPSNMRFGFIFMFRT